MNTIKPHILIVEDNPDNLKLLTWVLEDEDFKITAVTSGEDALEMLEGVRFDLVLMDIDLPGIDGEETTRRIRSQERYATLPIVAVTAHALKEEVERIVSNGFNALTTKPIDEEQIISLIHSVISKENSNE